MKSLSVTIQMKSTEQYFPVVLFIMLYKVVLAFESVDEILRGDHFRMKTIGLPCGAVYYAVKKGCFFFWVCGKNSKVTIQMKATK